MEGGPEAVAGAAEMPADGGGVEAGVDAGEENDEVSGSEVRDELVVCCEELGLGRFPGSGQFTIHKRRLWRTFAGIQKRKGTVAILRSPGLLLSEGAILVDQDLGAAHAAEEKLDIVAVYVV